MRLVGSVPGLEPRRRLTGAAVYCRKCHYDLSHTANERCPECGRTFDPKCAETYLTDVSGLSEARRRVRHVCLVRGILLPVAMLAYGGWCLATQTSFLPGLFYYGRLTRAMPIYGAPALGMGFGWIGCAGVLAGTYLLARLDSGWKAAPITVGLGTALLVLGWGFVLCWLARAAFA
jgi:hypothetical protein